MPPKSKALSELSGISIQRCQEKVIKNPHVEYPAENPVVNPTVNVEKRQKTGSTKIHIEASNLPSLAQFDHSSQSFYHIKCRSVKNTGICDIGKFETGTTTEDIQI